MPPVCHIVAFKPRDINTQHDAHAERIKLLAPRRKGLKRATKVSCTDVLRCAKLSGSNGDAAETTAQSECSCK